MRVQPQAATPIRRPLRCECGALAFDGELVKTRVVKLDAAGFVRELEREGGRLRALVEWTKLGRKWSPRTWR